MGLSLRNITKKVTDFGSRVYDQANLFDNGRTYQQRTPTNTRSVIGQATHNGVTNTVGNVAVKPVVNTVASGYNAGRLIGSGLGNNNDAFIEAQRKLGGSFKGSIPGIVADQVGNAYNLGRSLPGAVQADIRGFSGKAPTPSQQKDLQRGLTAFNRTGPGLLVSPVQQGIDTVIPGAREQSAAAGYDPKASGAKKFILDPALGALSAVGGAATIKGGAKFASRTVDTLGGKPKVTLKVPTPPSRPFDEPQTQIEQAPPLEVAKPSVTMKNGKTKVAPLEGEMVGGKVNPRNNGSLRDQVGEALIDKDAVIINQLKDIEKQTGRQGIVKQFLYNSNMQRQAPGIGTHNFTHSEHIQNAIGGLSKENYGNFTDYATARRELVNAKDGLKTSRPVDELASTVAEHHHQFGKNFDALNQYYKGLAEQAHEAGLIDADTLKKYNSDGNYIRLQRDMGDLQTHKGQGGGYSLRTSITGQKRTGSKRGVLDPVHTALEYTQRIQSEIQRNTTAKHLVETLSQHGLAKEVGEAGARHQNVLSFRDGGKVRHFIVDPEIKRVANNIAPFQLGTLAQVGGAPARLLRAGATALNPVFTASNIVKDQVGSAVISSKTIATHNPLNIASGLKNSAIDFAGGKTSKLYDEYIKRGGDRTQYDLTRNAHKTAEVVDRVRGGRKVGFKQSMLHPIRTLEDANAITEKATRFQNFKGIYEDSVKNGANHEQALQNATMAALEHTVNFGRAGSWGRIVNLAIPYSNAAIQGGRTLANAAKARPYATASKGFAWVGTPVAAATLWNMSDPERRKVYDNLRPYEKQNNIVLIKPGTKVSDVKNENYDIVKVPLPPDIGNIFQPIRRGIESALGGKKPNAGEIAADVTKPFVGPLDFSSGGALINSGTPQAAKPFVNQAANRDFYTGKQIVPDYLKDSVSDPKKRSTKHTSGTAQLIANATGIEPVRVDKFATDVAGKLGSFGINASDNALNVAGKIKPDKIGGQSPSAAFKQRFSQGSAIIDPTNQAAQHFAKVTDLTKGLNKNEMSAYNTIHTNKVDGASPDKTYYDSALKASIYEKFPKVLAADNKINKGNGEPFYGLPSAQQKVILTLNTLSDDPGNASAKKISKDNPWIQDYYDKQSSYFDKLAASGKLKDSSGNKLPTPPNATGSVKTALDTFGNIKDSTQKHDYLAQHPEVSDFFSQTDQYQRQKRETLGLPQFDKYPTPSPALQKKLDVYDSLPKHDGKKGGNATRSAFIKANPEISSFFSAVSQYGVIEDSKLAQFEGEDLSDKNASAASGGGGGSGGYASYTKKPAQFYASADQLVSTAAKGSYGKPKVSVKAPSLPKGKSKSKPRVAMKVVKSRV